MQSGKIVGLPPVPYIEMVSGAALPSLQLEIVVTNNEGKAKAVPARIQPAEIDYYYPGFYEGTVIVTKSPNSFLTMLSVEEFDQTLQAYWEAVKANPGVYGVLKITPKAKIHATS